MRPLLPTIWVSPSSCLLHHWQLIKEEVIENPLQETVQNPARVFCLGGEGQYNQWPYTKDQDMVEKSVGSKRGGYKDIYDPPPPSPWPPLPTTHYVQPIQWPYTKDQDMVEKSVGSKRGGYKVIYYPPSPTPPKSWQDSELSRLTY